MHETFEMRMLLNLRGGRVNLNLLARERSRRLIFHEGFRDRAMAIRAKAKSGPLACQFRTHEIEFPSEERIP